MAGNLVCSGFLGRALVDNFRSAPLTLRADHPDFRESRLRALRQVEVLHYVSTEFCMNSSITCDETSLSAMLAIVGKRLALMCRQRATGFTQDEVGRSQVPVVAALEPHRSMISAFRDQAQSESDGVYV